MLSQAMIDRLKGTIDYYYWKGIPCARKWPHWPARAPYPAEKANQDSFAYATKMWRFLPEFLKAQYIDMAVSTPVTGRDIFMRAYMNAARV